MAPINVLLLEDNSADAVLIEEMMAEIPGIAPLVRAATLAEAVGHLAGDRCCDLILSDLNLPDSDGLETLDGLLAIRSDVPVVMLTGLNDQNTALAAIRNGAQDYLVKGMIDRQQLERAIRYARERQRLLTDLEQNMKQMAHYDILTGLPNRALFQDRLSQALQAAVRNQTRVGLLFIDLDRFKPINDAFGHQAGDQILRELGQRLRGCVRQSDTVARLGGDEFTIILGEIRQPGDAVLAAEKAMAVIGAPFAIKNRQCCLGASIGIAIFPDHGCDSETLMRMADEAMYQAKSARGSTYCMAG